MKSVKGFIDIQSSLKMDLRKPNFYKKKTKNKDYSNAALVQSLFKASGPKMDTFSSAPTSPRILNTRLVQDG